MSLKREVYAVSIMVAALADWYTATITGDVLALDRLLNLFAEDAVYIEQFSGPDTTHTGKANIRGYLDGLLQQATPPVTQVTLREAVVDRDTIPLHGMPSISSTTTGSCARGRVRRAGYYATAWQRGQERADDVSLTPQKRLTGDDGNARVEL